LGTPTLERLSALRKVATIESIGSSTRIEGSHLSDKCLRRRGLLPSHVLVVGPRSGPVRATRTPPITAQPLLGVPAKVWLLLNAKAMPSTTLCGQGGCS